MPYFKILPSIHRKHIHLHIASKLLFPMIAILLAISILLGATTDVIRAQESTSDTQALAIENAASQSTQSSLAPISELYAKYAVILDAETGRVLAGKNETQAAPMASTTKIMTCVLALEYADPQQLCTTSSYAASMPDVQLDATKGEVFYLNDLMYSLMLKSHNDSAVIIAENVAYHYIYQVRMGAIEDVISLDSFDLSFIPNTEQLDSSFLANISTEQSKLLVSVFAALMNQKAQSLGCMDTYFITPNGLDASDENGTHSTTAKDLAVIMSYCIQNPDFLSITETASHTFVSYKSDASGNLSASGKQYSVSNANAFLNMYDNIISGKTGFTGDAGYCYVCAYQADNRTFIVVLLACGWPNNKTYKWHDARLLLNWAREKYYRQQIITTDYPLKTLAIKNGLGDSTSVYIEDTYDMLLSDMDVVNVVIHVPDSMEAPIYQGENVGYLCVYVNDELLKEIPVYASSDIIRTDYAYFFVNLLKKFIFIDN